MDNISIGLIGVGLLGSAIADRFASQGHGVLAFDVDSSKTNKLTGPHQSSTTPQEVFQQCDVIVVSLPNSDIATSVLKNVELRPTSTIIDTTTGSPDQMVVLEQLVREQHANYAEATVAGSSTQMRNGDCVIFLGCDEASKTSVHALVSKLSSRIFHLGPVGAASKFKLVHNLLLGLNRAVLAEALVFGESLGFDPSLTLGILQQTPAASGVMQTKGPKMANREYDPQARLSQHLKDVRLILQEANKHDTSVALSETHRALLEHAEQLGFGDADNSAVIEAIRTPPATDT